MSVYCYNKHVSTDTIYYDTPAIDGGSTYIQLFVCTKSLVLNLYGMKTDKHFFNTLEDNIRAEESISTLISNWDQSKVQNCAQSILW